MPKQSLFYLFLHTTTTTAAKRYLVVENQGENIHVYIAMTPQTGPLAALWQGLIPLFGRLRGSPS
jgi:hypothetical protein